MLQTLQGGEQGFERAAQERLLGLVGFVLLKSAQALGLKHALGLVAEQHGVAVKGYAHLVRVGVSRVHRLRIHLRGRHARLQCGAHIA